jgi:hypothetical protein
MKVSLRVHSVACEQVAAYVRKGQIPWPVTVIDVRDDDFEGECIRGAWHIPHDEAIANLYGLATEIMRFALQQRREASPNIKHQVIFHCMLSQYRGPHVATELATRFAAFHTRWAETMPAVASLGPPKIAVMQGGYERFLQLYREREGDLFAKRPLNRQNMDSSALRESDQIVGFSETRSAADRFVERQNHPFKTVLERNMNTCCVAIPKNDERSSHSDAIDDTYSNEIEQDEQEEDAAHSSGSECTSQCLSEQVDSGTSSFRSGEESEDTDHLRGER